MYEKNEKGRHLPSALHKSAARPARHRQAPAPAARLRYGFAAVCAALAPLLCPAPAQAGDDYDALILRARRRPPTGAGHAARPGSGRRPARHPGPHPGGQLGGPARRGDAGLRALPAGAAARRRSVGGGARCATCAAGRKRWRSSATACAPIRPSRLRRRHRHDAGGRRPARRGWPRASSWSAPAPGRGRPPGPGLCPCTQEYAV